MREEIRVLQQKLGLTVVNVTHDQSEALAVSGRIVFMKATEIAQTGTPRKLHKAPEIVFVATLMGEANHIAAKIAEVRGDVAIVDIDGVTLELPARGLAAGPADLVLRPEAIRMVAAGSATACRRR